MGIGCSKRGLWCALAASCSAREGCWAGSGLPCRYISAHISTYQHISVHISIPEVPTPLGLLSSPRGIAVSSRSISRYLGRALVAREAYRRLPLFDYLFSSFPPLPKHLLRENDPLVGMKYAHDQLLLMK